MGKCKGICNCGALPKHNNESEVIDRIEINLRPDHLITDDDYLKGERVSPYLSSSKKTVISGNQHALTATEMCKIIDEILPNADDRMIGSSKYRAMNLEPWEVMERCNTKEEFLAYLRLAALKHQLRLGEKNDTNILEDMEKAEHIIQKWIEVYKS